MGIEEVMYLLLTDIRGGERDENGVRVSKAVLERCTYLIQSDREGVVDALRYLMQNRKEGETYLAIYVAGKLKLHELKPDIEEVRKDFIDGKFPETQKEEPFGHYNPFYYKHCLKKIDSGLDALK